MNVEECLAAAARDIVWERGQADPKNRAAAELLVRDTLERGIDVLAGTEAGRAYLARRACARGAKRGERVISRPEGFP